MENILLIIHVITALAIIGFILIQQGKGAEAGASFGAGASQTVFGSSGSWNFFSKVTALLAFIFFVTSIGLAIMAKSRTSVAEKVLPAIEQFQVEQKSQESDLPTMDIDEMDVPSEYPSAGESDIPVE